MTHRSGCPINLAVEVLGDRWSIIVLRDIMFGNRRSYREILINSEEGIATNILAARLRHLEAEELIVAIHDPTHRQRRSLHLTAKAIALVPIMAQLGAWGVQYMPCTPSLAVRAKLLVEGGMDMWEDFMVELRHIHLGMPMPVTGRSVLAELGEAYRREQASIEAPTDDTKPE